MTDDSVRMEIKGLTMDPTSKVPIVILHDVESQLFLPIWIGVLEAQAIALRIEGVEPPRPMTHDLLRNSLDLLEAEVNHILISDLKDNTFFALIHLLHEGAEIAIDSRPSDAIALALRADAPIFVRRVVLEKAKALDLTETDDDRIRKWLEQAEPEDLGEYEM